MSYINTVNQYACGTCGGTITTIDRESGTTPMLLACRATDGCTGSMRSLMYEVDQTLTPAWEWYRPTERIKDPDTREHVKMGGLLLRRIESGTGSQQNADAIPALLAMTAMGGANILSSLPTAPPKRELTDFDQRQIASAEAKRERRRQRNRRVWFGVNA